MAKEKEIKIPNKTSMNLYQIETKGNSVPGFIVGLVIVAIVAFLIAQFGVISRLNKLNALEAEVSVVRTRLDAYENEMLEYPKTKENYLRYSDAYSRGAVVYVDRITIMELLESACADLGSFSSFSISGNSVTVKVYTKSLEDFDLIKNRLDSYELVTSVTPISHDDTSHANSVSNVFRFNVESPKEGE